MSFVREGWSWGQSLGPHTLRAECPEKPGSQEDGFATKDPSRAGQAELAEGGGLFCRAWPSLGAAPPWPAGLSPGPGFSLGLKVPGDDWSGSSLLP